MGNILKTLEDGISIQVLIPAVTLFLLLASMLIVFWTAQRREDFDLAEMLRGEDTKVSPWRVFAFGAFAFSSWALMSEVLNARLTDWLMWSYLVTWAGSPSLLKAMERWNGVLPFAKGSA